MLTPGLVSVSLTAAVNIIVPQRAALSRYRTRVQDIVSGDSRCSRPTEGGRFVRNDATRPSFEVAHEQIGYCNAHIITAPE